MALQWVDVSIPLAKGMTVWPGDQEFLFEPAARLSKGDTVNTSVVTMSTHTGTHVDAPWHFEADGKRLDEIDPTVFFGPSLVIDLPEVDQIQAKNLPNQALPPRVLFKTRNSARAAALPFDRNYVALAEEAAQRLVDDGVVLVGVDYLSVAPYKQPGQGTHHILLQADVFIVEGLRLAAIPSGIHQFTVLPLPIVGADGSPCRAFVGIQIS